MIGDFATPFDNNGYPSTDEKKDGKSHQYE
jgi:hypothetical protein